MSTPCTRPNRAGVEARFNLRTLVRKPLWTSVRSSADLRQKQWNLSSELDFGTKNCWSTRDFNACKVLWIGTVHSFRTSTSAFVAKANSQTMPVRSLRFRFQNTIRYKVSVPFRLRRGCESISSRITDLIHPAIPPDNLRLPRIIRAFGNDFTTGWGPRQLTALSAAGLQPPARNAASTAVRTGSDQNPLTHVLWEYRRDD